MKKGFLGLLCLAFLFGASGCTGVVKKVLNQEVKKGRGHTTDCISKVAVSATYEKKPPTVRQKMLGIQFSSDKKKDRDEKSSNIFLCWWDEFLRWCDNLFE